MCPPMVKIGLNDLPRSGRAKATPTPPLATALGKHSVYNSKYHYSSPTAPQTPKVRALHLLPTIPSQLLPTMDLSILWPVVQSLSEQFCLVAWPQNNGSSNSCAFVGSWHHKVWKPSTRLYLNLLGACTLYRVGFMK